MSARVAFVFVHGLAGRGEYDASYAKRPYWGGKSGDIVADLRDRGITAHAASVSPSGSAWDRACELYAQIEGTRCDYGLAHSRKCGHSRIGRDFVGQRLFDDIDDDTKLVLIGHSFGGVTIRLFAHLLAHGSDEERDASGLKGTSQLFMGGSGERVAAIVTLAAPTNGTSAYNMAVDSTFDKSKVKVGVRYKLFDRIMKRATNIKRDDRAVCDWADYDMDIDHALNLNQRIDTLGHVHYLSVAADATQEGPNNTRVPDASVIDPILMKNAALMGCYRTTTAGGVKVGDKWLANDGLVNTRSARAPFGATARDLKNSDPEPGIWNVMDDLHVDHAYFQGGFMRRVDPRPFYYDLIDRLTSLDF